MTVYQALKVTRSNNNLKVFSSASYFLGWNKILQNASSVRFYSFPSGYKPSVTEEGRYDNWDKSGVFKPKEGLPSYSLILPPPNVTGTLHLGHALTVTLQDILCRWKRMQNFSVIWVPGFDHAGIATQVVVEKKLKHEKNTTRHELGREKFIEEVMGWKGEKTSVIKNQLKRLGASLDWSQEIFTMDENQSNAVREAVIRLFESGLLYRDEMLVNWSCSLQSAISDIEVDHKIISGPTEFQVPGYEYPVEFGFMNDFAYKFADKEGEIVVSTTRIETMVGDVAVAVHPADDRFKNLEGTMLYHPFRDCTIPLIYDESVVPELGTGAVKITPAHSHTDLKVAKKHGLPILSVINEEGFLTNNCGIFSGQKRYDARAEVVKALEKEGLFRGSKSHEMAIPVCSRSGDIIELLLKPQWFMKLDDVGATITEALNKNEIKIEPAAFKSILLTWFSNNSRDWCVSRQIWWGHRLPLYFANDTWVAAHSLEEAKEKFNKKLNLNANEADKLNIKQDDDVLDTWFSSALLPFSAFGWPKETDNLKRFYPLSLMETGNDIVCFWVARMLSLGLCLTKQLPFNDIILHGMMADPHGRKMSKSRGNVIDPQHVIYGASLEELNEELKKTFEAGYLSAEEYEKALKGQKLLFPQGISECGADALRLTLSSHNFRNSFINFDWKECHKNKLFGNKILQACKFVSFWREKVPVPSSFPEESESLIERWILSRLANAVFKINEGLNSYNFHHATKSILMFLVEEFCDIFVESSKPILKEGSEAERLLMCHNLFFCMETFLRLLAPFMPFLAEELYMLLTQKSVHFTPFPLYEDYSKFKNSKVEEQVKYVLEITKSLRRLQLAHKVPKSDLNFVIKTDKLNDIANQSTLIKNLAKCNTVVVSQEAPVSHFFMDSVNEDTSVYLLMNLENFNFIEYKKELIFKEAKLLRQQQQWDSDMSQETYSKKPERFKLQDKKKVEKLSKEISSLSNYLDLLEKWGKTK